jgi:hypothetical protein
MMVVLASEHKEPLQKGASTDVRGQLSGQERFVLPQIANRQIEFAQCDAPIPQPFNLDQRGCAYLAVDSSAQSGFGFRGLQTCAVP